MLNSNTAKEWKQYIEDYRSSGLTATAWSEKNKKSVHKLRYWITQFNKENKKVQEKQWISVPIKKQCPDELHPSINLKIGFITIEVNSGFDKNVLMDVLSVVQSYDKRK